MSGRIVTVVGARPQFVKAAVVSAALTAAGVEERVVHTGQHYDADMSDVFFRELGVPPPAHHLGIGGLPHGAQTGRMMEALEKVFVEEKPACVLIYGDTDSTLAGALAAVKMHIPVAHVEAGMRSHNRAMPEEINRLVSDHVSTWLLVTHAEPQRILASEGIHEGVRVVGDVMCDAARVFADASLRTGALTRRGLTRCAYGLVTVHRAENTDDPSRLKRISSGLEEVAKGLPLVFPVHPRTRRALRTAGITFSSLVRTIEPIGYLEMLALEQNAALVLTDSGGVQKEAFFAGVPCVTLRRETEWTETVELDWNELVDANPEAIAAAARRALARSPGEAPPPIYGDGFAAPRVARILEEACAVGRS